MDLIWFLTISTEVAVLIGLIWRRLILEWQWFSTLAVVDLAESALLYRAYGMESYRNVWLMYQIANFILYGMAIWKTEEAAIRTLLSTYLGSKLAATSLYLSWFYSSLFHWHSHRREWIMVRYLAHHVMQWLNVLNLGVLIVLAVYTWKGGDYAQRPNRGARSRARTGRRSGIARSA